MTVHEIFLMLNQHRLTFSTPSAFWWSSQRLTTADANLLVDFFPHPRAGCACYVILILRKW